MNLPVSIDQNSGEPLYRQLYKELKDAIIGGRLKPGQLLPPTRKLADMLGVSRITVVRSYRDLLSQGYLEAATGRGTFVSNKVLMQSSRTEGNSRPKQVHQRILDSGISPFAQSLMESADDDVDVPMPGLNFGTASKEMLPVKAWKQVLFNYLRRDESRDVQYTLDPFGDMKLRESLTGYLRRSRGLDCVAEQVALFQTAQHPRRLLVQMLIEPGDVVAMENPGFPAARQLLETAGAIVQPISVDHMGISVSELRSMAKPPKIVYVTPSHQDPTGIVMPVSRRKELLDWADTTGTIIVEDDFNNEYHYGTPAPRALQGLDRSANVIYMSNFWQVLFPLTNIGFIVLPEHFISAFRRAKAIFDRSFPTVEHFALQEFIEDGHLERHIAKTRVIYARRRQSLIFALSTRLRNLISFPTKGSGLHIFVHLQTNLSDDEIMEMGEEAGLQIMSTREFYQSGSGRVGEFIISFGFADEAVVRKAADRFVELILEKVEPAPERPTMMIKPPADMSMPLNPLRGYSINGLPA